MLVEALLLYTVVAAAASLQTTAAPEVLVGHEYSCKKIPRNSGGCYTNPTYCFDKNDMLVPCYTICHIDAPNDNDQERCEHICEAYFKKECFLTVFLSTSTNPVVTQAAPESTSPAKEGLKTSEVIAICVTVFLALVVIGVIVVCVRGHVQRSSGETRNTHGNNNVGVNCCFCCHQVTHNEGQSGAGGGDSPSDSLLPPQQTHQTANGHLRQNTQRSPLNAPTATHEARGSPQVTLDLANGRARYGRNGDTHIPVVDAGTGDTHAPVGDAGIRDTHAPVVDAGIHDTYAAVVNAEICDIHVPVVNAGIRDTHASVVDAETRDTHASVVISGIGQTQGPVVDAGTRDTHAPVVNAGIGDTHAAVVNSGTRDTQAPVVDAGTGDTHTPVVDAVTRDSHAPVVDAGTRDTHTPVVNAGTHATQGDSVNQHGNNRRMGFCQQETSVPVQVSAEATPQPTSDNS